MADTPRLPTRVGQALWGDNRFCGHSVRDELAGHSSVWQLLALAVGHPGLGAEGCAVLEDLVTCSCAADPRIWAMKTVRLGSAWGSFTTGVSAGLLATDGLFGPGSVQPCAESLLSIGSDLAGDDDDVLDAIVTRHLAAAQGRLHGFGVPVRGTDERVTAIAACLAQRGLDGLPFWSLLRRVEAALIRRRGARANIGGACAAVLLDLGFAPSQAPPLVLMCALVSIVANAHEGAAQAPAVLRELPQLAIRYVGTAARPSPRSGG